MSRAPETRFRAFPALPQAMRRGLLLLAFAGTALAAAPDRDTRGLPSHLRDTGLYSGATQPAPGIIEFSPQYPLWSDGAGKRRWLYLPPGSFIDASRADAWEFPRGTRLWKEFGYGSAIETRYIELGADGLWRYGSYVWNAQGSDAVLAPPEGLREVPAPRAPAGSYAIPAENDCRACHEGAPVPVLGFSALQLSDDRDPLAPHAGGVATTLRELAARGLLRNLPAQLLAQAPRIAAASAAERAALGYLHGNCGHCHNDDGPLAVLELNLSLRASAGFDAAAVRRTVVGVPSQLRIAGAPPGSPRISPGHVSTSVLAQRMRSRDPLQQMPPLGSALADGDALALLAQWVESLDTPVN